MADTPAAPIIGLKLPFVITFITLPPNTPQAAAWEGKKSNAKILSVSKFKKFAVEAWALTLKLVRWYDI